SGPASQGQFSGNGCREHVMTRQPAAEKRLTVAWPMPRLAPVSSNVRRGWFACKLCMPFLEWFLVSEQVDASLRVEPRLVPWRVRALAFELEAIVQSKRSLLPEFDR